MLSNELYFLMGAGALLLLLSKKSPIPTPQGTATIPPAPRRVSEEEAKIRAMEALYSIFKEEKDNSAPAARLALQWYKQHGGANEEFMELLGAFGSLWISMQEVRDGGSQKSTAAKGLLSKLDSMAWGE